MTRICLSIGITEDLFSPSVDMSDLLELRVDKLGAIPGDLPGSPFIVTLGDTDHELHPRIIEEALDRGAWLIDVGEHHIDQLDEEFMMMSHHDWDITPPTERIIDLFSSLRGKVRKCAFMVNGYRDLMSIMEASASIRGRRVLIGMGELGAITRIRSDILGNEFTFAHGGRATAPGQLPVEEMRELGEDPVILGVTGRPLGHSLSPPMHRAALKASGIRGKYLRFDVPEIDMMGAFMKAYDVRGMNVTIPYKVQALSQMDSLDATAKAVGAINTISNEGGNLVGYNTDVLGIKEALWSGGYRIEGGNALVVGTGGAARACCHALISEGGEVTVTGRDPEKARALAEDMRCMDIDKVRGMEGFDLVVNCTPLGMEGFPEDSPFDVREIHEGQTVFDMVYRPRETPLIREAAAKGANTIEGIEMLIHQALASFRIWTGKDVDQDVMREAVL